MKRILLVLIAATSSLSVFSQGEIPVNMYTGSAGIYVNLYTLSDHDLSESLTMSYNVNGVNLNSGSTYGGWNLQVGGQISRQVRGLPDDFGFGDTRKGWLYNSNYSAITSFPNSSTTNPATCDNFQTDLNYITGLNYLVDTEPDLFSFSVGGYSGKFVFDNYDTIRLIPYQDLKIIPTYNNYPNDMTIIGWTITTNAGIVYTLNDKTQTSRTITKTTDQQYVSILDRTYNYYKTTLSYNSGWNLTSVVSPTGARLTYAYTSTGTTGVSNPWNVKFFNPDTGISSDVFSLMTDVTTSTSRIVYSVKTSDGKRVTCDPVKGITVYDTLIYPKLVKSFSFSYTSGVLTAITEQSGDGCTSLPPYQFAYNTWTGNYMYSTSQDFWGFYNGNNASNSRTSSSFFPVIYVYPSEPANERFRINRIPSYSGTEIILGTDSDARKPDATNILSGTLKSITYPTGALTSFTWEINKYYDTRIGQDQLGGGLRIANINYSDNANPSANAITNYSYLDSLGHSSGKLMSRPSFVIPLWQQKIPHAVIGSHTYTAHSTTYSQLSGNAIWQDLVAITSADISDQGDTQGSPIGYSRVTVSRAGNGKAIYSYYVPAGYGDAATGGTSTDWTPTKMKYARPTTCPTMGIIPGAENYGYAPFPQAEYDYERGLVKRKQEYNETGTLVRQTQTSYQYIFKKKTGGSPVRVVGLSYDLFANSTGPIYLYGQYTLVTQVAKVVLSETVTTYDENNSSRLLAGSTQYIYGSSKHRYLSQIKNTTPDGTIYNSYLQYVPDYPATSSQTNTLSYMIYQLNTANRTNTVIEQYSTIQLPGGTEKVTGASLTEYNPFNFNKPLLKYQLAFRPLAPVPLTTGSNKFIPSSIDGSDVFHNDSRYDIVQTVNEYDNYSSPISATGENGATSGVLLGYNYQRYPVAQFSQAQSTNIAFSDLETTTPATFALTNNYYGPGHTGTNGIYPGATLTRTITKPANTSHYLLTLWAKRKISSSSMTLNVTLTWTGTGSPSSQPMQITFTRDSSARDSLYQYFTRKIDVSAIPDNASFTIQVQGQSFSTPSGSVGSYNANLRPLLDDIGFYPDYVSLASTTYTLPFGASSVTDASGNTAYTVYDNVGRTKWLLDQDRNIRSNYTYSIPGTAYKPLAAAISGITGSIIVNQNFTLVAASNPCYPNATYQWSFDNGTTYSTASSSTSSPMQNHSSAGSYTVYLKVNSAGVTSVTTSTVITVGSSYDVLAVNVTSGGINGSGYVTLTATPSNTDGMPVTYQWYQRVTGNSTWNIIPNTTSSTTQKVIPQTSVDFQCVITSSDGRTANSNLTVSN